MIQKYGRQNGKQQYFLHVLVERNFNLGDGKMLQRKRDISLRIYRETNAKNKWEKKGGRRGNFKTWGIYRKEKILFWELEYSCYICEIILVVDTTYFEQFGLMVFRASSIKKNLLWYIVPYETNEKYKEGIQFLLDKGLEDTNDRSRWETWIRKIVSKYSIPTLPIPFISNGNEIYFQNQSSSRKRVEINFVSVLKKQIKKVFCAG